MKIVASTERAFLPALKKVASRARVQGTAVEKTVKSILQAVERGGDKAVLRYSKQFDRVSMKDTGLRVTPEEIKEAYFHIRKDEGDALRFAAKRITAFHERQRIKTWMYHDNEATLGQVVTPVDAVGVYVPGGKAVYPSSVLMCAIPAKVAGVSRVVMCTPPQKGQINPYLLVAADIAGVTEIYRVGGVQAIGAMAYGTKTIQRVDKIVGPGNIYVATAKRLLYGTVGIDMVAGPSELLVVADSDAKPAHVAADLLCEAEHDEDAQVYLVTTSAQLAKDVVQLIGSQLKGLQREKIAARSIARCSACSARTARSKIWCRTPSSRSCAPCRRFVATARSPAGARPSPCASRTSRCRAGDLRPSSSPWSGRWSPITRTCRASPTRARRRGDCTSRSIASRPSSASRSRSP